MLHLRALAVMAALGLAATAAGAVTVEDFESGDLSAWYIKAPHYTTLSLVSPGSGGSVNALSIQETPGALGGRSSSALARRVFQIPANWSGYTTLELDARISGGEWNGYSLRLYNDGRSVLLRGIHSDSSVTGFRTLRFDISGVQRDKITELLFYVNRTAQNAGQALIIDNIRLSTVPVTVDPERTLENFSSGDISRWTPGGTTPFVNLSLVSGNSPGDFSSPAQALSSVLASTSQSALFRWRPAKTMDWYDYTTLEFDVRLPVGTVTDGFSVRLYNAGADVRLKKFVPQSGYVTCQVDISKMERDQVNEVLFYVNRTGAYNPASKPQTLHLDNLRLTRNPVPPTPDVLMLDDFESGDFFNWDWIFRVYLAMQTGDFVSAPYSLDIKLTGPSSSSAYTRRSWILGGSPTQDWEDYNSLVFEAKVLKGLPGPNYPVGFSVNPVSGPASSQLWFYPSGYDQWETIALDISNIDVDQVSWLRFYVNRCLRDDFNVVTGDGQILRLDNLRLSKEPAPPVVIDSPDADDFEDGDIQDWYYSSYHEYPSGSGDFLDGTTAALTTDASSGNYALQITNLTPPGSTSAYRRKTLHRKWDGYRTLQFDAKVKDSVTSQGFAVLLRNFSGYGPVHEFTPTGEWQTFKIDISGDKVGTTTTDVRPEVIGLLFYVNRQTGYGVAQNGQQKLLLDNIRVTNEPVQTQFASIGDAKRVVQNGGVVTLTGKVCAGYFPDVVPDREQLTNLRPVFFIVEPDRSSALPVVVSRNIPDAQKVVPAGSVVNVTGVLTWGYGTRYLYATSLEITGTGGQIPSPVYLSNVQCGSAGYGLDAGVPHFRGLDTTGMLAVISGKILSVGSDTAGRAFMYVDDGSRVQADNGAVGVKVYDFTGGTIAKPANVGRFVKITGFVMNDPEIDPQTQQPTFRPIRAFWPKQELPNAVQFVD
jgi:hypothetical protein